MNEWNTINKLIMLRRELDTDIDIVITENLRRGRFIPERLQETLQYHIDEAITFMKREVGETDETRVSK